MSETNIVKMVKAPAKPRAPRTPKPQQTPIAAANDPLPSMNIKHSGDLENRIYILQADTSNTRLRVQAEMDGQAKRHDDARADIVAKHERELREMDEAHAKSAADFVAQLADLDRSIDIINGALSVAKATEAPAS